MKNSTPVFCFYEGKLFKALAGSLSAYMHHMWIEAGRVVSHNSDCSVVHHRGSWRDWSDSLAKTCRAEWLDRWVCSLTSAGSDHQELASDLPFFARKPWRSYGKDFFLSSVRWVFASMMLLLQAS